MTQSVPSPFKNVAYRTLFCAQVTSLIGTGLTTIALGLLAYDLAPDQAGWILGMTLAIKMIAYVFVAPIAGGFAHLLPRKTTLILLDVIRAGLIFCLPFVENSWQLFALIFVLNSFSACFTPLFQSIIPDLLPNEERYTKALSYSRLAYDLENLLSPSLAALLLTIWQFDHLFLFNSATFLISALLVLLTSLPAKSIAERTKGILSNMTFGVRAYLKTPRLKALLCLHMAVACAGGMVIVNSVVYVRHHLGLGETETAYAFMASGLGSMIMAFLIPKLLKTISDRSVMIIGASIISSALLWGMIQPDFIGLLVIWFFLGVGWSIVQTPAARVVNRSTSKGDRAAYFSANFALSHACWFIGYLLAGWSATHLGLSQSFVLLSCLATLSTLCALKFWPQDDPIMVEHTHPAHDHEHPHTHNDPHHDHDHEGWEGPEPHIHEHRHKSQRHSHAYVIDAHHAKWPQR